MRSDDVFDCCIGCENVVVVRSSAVHQPHTYTVTTGTNASLDNLKHGWRCTAAASAAMLLLYTDFVTAHTHERIPRTHSSTQTCTYVLKHPLWLS